MVDASMMVLMCVSVVILSSGAPVRRAVTCMTAVRKAVGLKSPGSQSDSGVTSSSVHSWSCWMRSSMSANCASSALSDGQAMPSHRHRLKGLRPGHWFSVKAVTRSSMACDMLSWPLRPLSSSMSERRISPTSVFMRLHSCTATVTKGAVGPSMSGSALSPSVIISKSSGRRSIRSVMVPFTMSSPEPPPSPPPPPAPWIARMVMKS
mmetsp:Transcript_29373/g.94256  ORF Transcript_29373/g.94256 Transcript_29373/m.94256 type:complete len:207 (+) Transcript_29373:553-1173(+)